MRCMDMVDRLYATYLIGNLHHALVNVDKMDQFYVYIELIDMENFKEQMSNNETSTRKTTID